MCVLKVKVISLPCIFQVLYVLCFTGPRYQVSVYRTIGLLVLSHMQTSGFCTTSAQRLCKGLLETHCSLYSISNIKEKIKPARYLIFSQLIFCCCFSLFSYKSSTTCMCQHMTKPTCLLRKYSGQPRNLPILNT